MYAQDKPHTWLEGGRELSLPVVVVVKLLKDAHHSQEGEVYGEKEL
jgi:hypothetical protein